MHEPDCHFGQSDEDRGVGMHESISPMKKQTVYAEGKTAFVNGKRRVFNPYRWHDKELASIWADGWDHAKKAKEANDRGLR